MKKITWIIGLALLAIVPVMAWTSVANAQRFASNVEEGQKVHSSLYSSGKTIDIRGEIFGDVFCAGQTVNIDAIVHGDILCAGVDVSISGKVDGDIRVGGQVVSIDADIAQSATIAGMTLSLDADAKVGQDLTATGDNLTVKGSVGRDIVISGNAIALNGSVGRNVSVKSERVNVRNKAAIAGNITYTAVNKPVLADDAKLQGEMRHIAPRKHEGGNGFDFRTYLFVLFSLVIIGLLLALLFPQFLVRTSGRIRKSIWKVLLTGAIASALIPLMGLVLGISVVGIPLAIFLLVGGAFGVALSGPIAGYYAGRLIFRDGNQHPALIAAVGGAVVVTTYFIPVVGFVFLILAFWLGFGALLLDLQDHIQASKQAPVPAKTKK